MGSYIDPLMEIQRFYGENYEVTMPKIIDYQKFLREKTRARLNHLEFDPMSVAQ